MIFTRHAEEQIRARGISKELILEAISNPISKKSESGLRVFHYIYNDNGKTLLLRVFVNETVMPNKIVTAYKTSKIDKYHAD